MIRRLPLVEREFGIIDGTLRELVALVGQFGHFVGIWGQLWVLMESFGVIGSLYGNFG